MNLQPRLLFELSMWYPKNSEEGNVNGEEGVRVDLSVLTFFSS